MCVSWGWVGTVLLQPKCFILVSYFESWMFYPSFFKQWPFAFNQDCVWCVKMLVKKNKLHTTALKDYQNNWAVNQKCSRTFYFSSECSYVMSTRACKRLRFLNEPCLNHMSKYLKSAPHRSTTVCFSSYYFFLFPTPSHSHRFNFHYMHIHHQNACKS